MDSADGFLIDIIVILNFAPQFNLRYGTMNGKMP